MNGGFIMDMNKVKQLEGNVFSFNFSGKALEACIRSSIVADFFCTALIEPIHMFFALTLDPNCPIHKYSLEKGMVFNAVEFLEYVFNNPSVYEKLTNDDYPYDLSSNCEKNSSCSTETTSNANSSVNAETTSNITATENSEVQNNSGETVNAESVDKSYIKKGLFIELDLNNLPNAIHQLLLEAGKETDNNTIEPDFDDFCINYSDSLTEIILKTGHSCIAGNQKYIDENNLLYQIIVSDDESLDNLFNILGISKAEFANYILINYVIFNDYNPESLISIPYNLKNCCTVLNYKFSKDTTCDILGRDNELNLLWNIFSKKTKRNAVLVGDPGVGKTAVVEALTMQIVNQTCPKKFLNYVVIELNVVGMVAGTKYRGEFEQKICTLIDFLENADNITVFVDEIHQLLGAGSCEGSIDMSGSLKPILARDNVIFVGATTKTEYDKVMAKDGAFQRRFEVVTVDEPSFSETKQILLKRVDTLSKFHGVTVPDNVLDYVMVLAIVFNNKKSNPDKTIDLLDRSLAFATMQNSTVLTVEHVNSIFKKNYDVFNHLSTEYKKLTAYHEAGHYLVLMLKKEILQLEPIVVSIIPNGEGTAGSTNYEKMKYANIVSNRDYYYALISLDLAGRIAQSFFCSNFDDGASSDLEHANKTLDYYLTMTGITSEAENLIIPFSSTHSIGMSDIMLDKIVERKKLILSSIYSSTEKLIGENLSKLERIVNLLLEKGFATAAELEKVFLKD